MARDSTVDVLAPVRLFSSLTKRELGLVGRASDVVDVEAGRELVRQGEPGRELYLILDGTAAVRRNRRRTATLGPGDYFGELSLLDGGPRSATVEAVTPLRVLVMARPQLEAVLTDVPTLAHKLLVAMAARLRDADSKAFAGQ